MTTPMCSAADRLNSRLAWLLSRGSGVSCWLIAIGMVLRTFAASARSGADRLVSTGIVLLIALPTIRVATMGVCFLFRREFDFALIAALVLAILVASTLLGVAAG
ncbi:DUF1634 domain-containing protein [Dyella flava]|uniref:DUF1634 domain-containing protein n=1 Tax=Dyella flava TaxID=1920170 RepID=A0ABS2K5V0_9GAMM|nr:DUF1634 domain-containing protein [Dyella flava]MBM7126259.1 DUF1634 domain-containing protein [Dyella flava]